MQPRPDRSQPFIGEAAPLRVLMLNGHHTVLDLDVGVVIFVAVHGSTASRSTVMMAGGPESDKNV